MSSVLVEMSRGVVDSVGLIVVDDVVVVVEWGF